MSNDAKTDNEVILTTALDFAYAALNDLIDECIAVDGIPHAPTRQAIVKARRLLPAQFKHSFVERSALAAEGGYSIFSHAQNGHYRGGVCGLQPGETAVILSRGDARRVIPAIDKKGDVTVVIDNEPLPPGVVHAPDDSVRLKGNGKRKRAWAVDEGLGLGPRFSRSE